MNTALPAPPASVSPGKNGHLDFLDGLRGGAALYVVFFHFLGWDNENYPKFIRLLSYPLHYGHTAVNLFIVLSGFSLMLSIARRGEERLTRDGFGDYLKRRARRILPPYYAALALSLITIYLIETWLPFPSRTAGAPSWRTDFSLPAIASNLFLFHNLNLPWVGRSNPVLWSVATEWQIYFVFPLLLLPLWYRFGSRASVTASVILSLLPLLLGIGHLFLTVRPWYVTLFALGMMGAVFTVRRLPHWSGSKRFHQSLLLLTALAVATAALTSRIQIPGGTAQATTPQEVQMAYTVQMVQDVAVGVIVTCLILFLAQKASERTSEPPLPAGAPTPLSHRVLRFLESPAAKQLAGFSYSLYLTHYLFWFAAKRLQERADLPALPYILLILVFWIPLSLVFAFGFARLFERTGTTKRIARTA